MALDASAIAARLSRGQRSTLLALDDVPAMLGCAEPCAIGLAKPTSRRGALTVATGVGLERRFALTTEGEAVKAELLAMRETA